jgi:hypothetical protein
MIAALAAVLLGAVSASQSLSDIVSNAAFHVYVMPSSAEPDSVTVLASDSQSRPTSVKIVYRLGDRLELTMLETMRSDDDTSSSASSPEPSSGPTGQTYVVNGYPATYSVTGPYYQHVGWLTWRPPGVTVTISSMDMTDAPTLVNAALALY